MTSGYLFENFNLNIPENWQVIRSIDLHTGGEPLRVLTHGLPAIKGNTILEKRRYFRDNLDYIRTGTMFEPRGHADMYGAIITEPVTNNADFGTFFMHNEGYSTMCGHAIIALVKLVLDTHIIEKDVRNPEIIIDAPPGQIKAVAEIHNGIVQKVSFTNVPSFVLYQNETVEVDGIGVIKFDIAFGGAFYALCEARQFDLKLVSSEYDQLIKLGRKIKETIQNKYEVIHPFEEDLSFLYGTIFVGEPIHDPEIHSRNVCIFANGEVDRSSTGSGVSARAAQLFLKQDLKILELIKIESILGTTMDVKILESLIYGPYEAVIPEVSGTAHITGKHTFFFDPDDPLKKGFIFR
jgi:trans-L-3-hydroxyproline dehydratase